MSTRAIAPTVAAPIPVLAPVQRPMLQRSCDCGQHTGGGECERCKKKKKQTLQRQSSGPSGPDFAPGIVHDVLGSAGEPLGPSTREAMEPRFGQDFSQVRVHTDAKAAESARTVNARAYTVGRNIVFNAGEYAPASNQGRLLLAHELTHVLQQSNSGPSSIQRKLEVGPTNDRFERQADEVAEQITAGTGPSDSAVSKFTLTLVPARIQRAAAESPVAEPAGPGPAANSNRANLIVDDDAQSLHTGQMRKHDFLDKLKAAACASADEALTSVGRTAKGCPYLERWIEHLRTKDSHFVERGIRKYAPESAGVTNAEGYLPFVAARVSKGVTHWARTGEITEVPDELKGQLLVANAADAMDRLFSGVGGVIGAVGSAVVGGVRAVGGLFAKAREGGVHEARNPLAIQEELGAGHPLDGGVKSRMESAFGGDFSGVRIHNDSTAASLSTQLNARAFTVGRDVAFGAGEYQPGTLIGDALVAHELAHVVQQGNNVSSLALTSQNAFEYRALEEDADVSAVDAVATIWGRTTAVSRDIGKNALPRLRSGLRLQRCSRADKTEKNSQEANVSEAGVAKIPPKLPAFECAPQEKTLSDVGIAAGKSTALGVTLRSEPKKVPTLAFSKAVTGDKCTVSWNNRPEGAFALDPFMSVRQDIYNLGNEKPWDGPCKGKEVPVKKVVSADDAAKAKAAETEHCNDHKRAYALTYGKLDTLIGELGGGYPPGPKGDCKPGFEEQFKNRVGFDWSDFGRMFKCLDDKSHQRDDQDWHTARYKHVLAPDCKEDKLVTEPNSYQEIGKHPSEEVVKGCGQPD